MTSAIPSDVPAATSNLGRAQAGRRTSSPPHPRRCGRPACRPAPLTLPGGSSATTSDDVTGFVHVRDILQWPATPPAQPWRRPAGCPATSRHQPCPADGVGDEESPLRHVIDVWGDPDGLVTRGPGGGFIGEITDEFDSSRAVTPLSP